MSSRFKHKTEFWTSKIQYNDIILKTNKNHQNRTRVDFGIMFLKNVVLHEIYSKKSVTVYFWQVSVVSSFHVMVTTYYIFFIKIRSLIFYYIFHVKPHFLKTLFQSRLLFDFDDFFTNKNRIKCSFTLILA
jgi:hypothetical protein